MDTDVPNIPDDTPEDDAFLNSGRSRKTSEDQFTAEDSHSSIHDRYSNDSETAPAADNYAPTEEPRVRRSRRSSIPRSSTARSPRRSHSYEENDSSSEPNMMDVNRYDDAEDFPRRNAADDIAAAGNSPADRQTDRTTDRRMADDSMSYDYDRGYTMDRDNRNDRDRDNRSDYDAMEDYRRDYDRELPGDRELRGDRGDSDYRDRDYRGGDRGMNDRGTVNRDRYGRSRRNGPATRGPDRQDGYNRGYTDNNSGGYSNNRSYNSGGNYGNSGGYNRNRSSGPSRPDGYRRGRGLSYNDRESGYASRRDSREGGMRGSRPIEPRGYDPTLVEDPTQLREGNGVLELHPSGYGFMRDPKANYVRQLTDPFVPGNMIDRFGLREGVQLEGMVQPGRRGQGPRLRELTSVDGIPPEDFLNVKTFDQLTPITPEQWLQLEMPDGPISTRVIDLLAPLGKGQRSLIVAPPRTGKTVLLRQISQAIGHNFPDMKLFMLLIDERPEEVTDMMRAVPGEVVASSLDREIESHVRLSQLIIERCKRLAEMGHDVFLLLDSITRLARAFNKWVGNTGRTMSGGVDIKAMDIPKKQFATARAFEEGGSLTIVGTALIDTGSRMDELIFQEFKGTGNMELVLDRKLSDRRVWPAIDLSQSGTRREEKLLPEDFLGAATALRRTLSQLHHVEAMEALTAKLAKFKTNQEFVDLVMSSRQYHED